MDTPPKVTVSCTFGTLAVLCYKTASEAEMLEQIAKGLQSSWASSLMYRPYRIFRELITHHSELVASEGFHVESQFGYMDRR